MTFEEIMKEQMEDKKLVNDLKIPYLTSEDKEVCNYVSKQLSSISLSNGSINCGKSISLEELINNSFIELSIFDGSLIDDLLNILNVSKFNIYRTDDKYGFGTCVNYEHNLHSDIIPLMGKVSAYVIPNELYELSTIFLTHEHIHSLKDTIYYEYFYNKTLGETIPMFYELISCSNKENLRNEIMKIRLSFLLDNNKEYLLFNGLFSNKISNFKFKSNSDLEELDLYSFLRSKVGCYLNSFYYAIMLYHLYKIEPKKILDLVSMVLRQEMTTLDLLNNLDIYGYICGEVFEKELGKVRKRII